MGVVCGHLNDLLLKTNFRWKFGRFTTTVRPGAAGDAIPGFRVFLCPGGGNARYFELFNKGYFC